MSARTRENPDVMVVHKDRTLFYKDCAHPYERGEPNGYVAWHDWADKHCKTHEHTRCPKCGLFVICARLSLR